MGRGKFSFLPHIAAAAGSEAFSPAEMKGGVAFSPAHGAAAGEQRSLPRAAAAAAAGGGGVHKT